MLLSCGLSNALHSFRHFWSLLVYWLGRWTSYHQIQVPVSVFRLILETLEQGVHSMLGVSSKHKLWIDASWFKSLHGRIDGVGSVQQPAVFAWHCCSVALYQHLPHCDAVPFTVPWQASPYKNWTFNVLIFSICHYHLKGAMEVKGQPQK